MVPTISDPLESEYDLLVVTPFLIESQVECTVAKEYGSKLDERADLQALVEREWTRVASPSVFTLDARIPPVSVQPIQVSIQSCHI